MTLDLEAIKRRYEAATPGPWHTTGNDGWPICVEDEPDKIVVYSGPDECDAGFIAHARTDIPALVAEVERLRSHGAFTIKVEQLRAAQAELEKLRAENDELRDRLHGQADISALATENKRLVGQLSHHKAELQRLAQREESEATRYLDALDKIRVELAQTGISNELTAAGLREYDGNYLFDCIQRCERIVTAALAEPEPKGGA